MNSNTNPKLSAKKMCQNSYLFKWNFTDDISCLSVHIMDTVRTNNMSVAPPRIYNDAVENYMGKYMELVLA